MIPSLIIDVIVTGDKARVSNSGDLRPGKSDLTAPGGVGTAKVRVDPVRHIANEGTVNVIDLAANKERAGITVELHASAMALSPDKKQHEGAGASGCAAAVMLGRRKH